MRKTNFHFFLHKVLKEIVFFSHHTSYDTSASTDQYSQGYSAPPPTQGYANNGYAQSGYGQPASATGYAAPTEYDQSQYQTDYR